MPRPASALRNLSPDTDLLLISVSGPEPVERALEHSGPNAAVVGAEGSGGIGGAGAVLTIGRRTTHALVLDRPEVSRDHAEFRYIDTADGPRWVLVDLGSRHQTRLNGQPLPPHEPCPVQAGDIIEISPWTLRLVVRDGKGAALAGASRERQVRTLDDDVSHTLGAMRTITAASGDLAQERLRLLLSCAEAIVAAEDEQALAEAVIDAATRGTGFPNAALLRPLMPDGTVVIIAETGAIHSGDSPQSSHHSPGPRLSRSLIREASQGQPVQVSTGDMIIPTAHSIVDLKIQQAMCVPLMLEGAAAGYLYLDTRSESPIKAMRTRISEDAGAFAAGLARLAALALMNLMRRDLEKRYGRMEGEIAAAASAQRLILPPVELSVGPVNVVGECRPGRIVSGDFFDVLPLTDGRIAIALGDVAGKGMQASVLMTTTQGFLRGVLMRTGNLRQAVSDLNAYLYPRCDGGRFISLWLGAIDAQLSTLEFVNAGHGHAWMHRLDGSFQQLNDAGGPLVGVADGIEYRSAIVPMSASERLVLLSDGILEQPHGQDREDDFGWARVRTVLVDDAEGPGPMMARLFEAVHTHAGGETLADDATVVVAGW